MHDRLDMLDGWRALSILCVLAGHLLPLGPGAWGLNGAVAATGMVIFFNLSGLLITRILLTDPHVPSFLVRRLFRIVPLAWLAMLALVIWTRPDPATIAANFGFYANLPEVKLMHGGEHLWSLCVEMQFYIAIALLVLCGGRNSLFLLPFLGLGITGLRIWQDVPISIITWQRVDEILAGATIAILIDRGVLSRLEGRLPVILPVLLLPLIVFAAHPDSGALNFARPWISAAAVGASLIAAPALMQAIFRSRTAVYIAAVSYALYVFHAMLTATWLGSGDTIEKYLKRPLLIGLTFGLAHASTFLFEKRMIRAGKTIIGRMRQGAPVPAGTP